MRARAIGKRTPMSPNAPATSSREIGQCEILSCAAAAVPNSLSPRRRTNDHDFCGLDQCRRRLADFQFEIAAGIAGDNGGDDLPAHIQSNLRQQPHGLEANNPPDQLVSSTDDFLKARARLGLCFRSLTTRTLRHWLTPPLEQQSVDFRLRDAMMPAHGNRPTAVPGAASANGAAYASSGS